MLKLNGIQYCSNQHMIATWWRQSCGISPETTIFFLFGGGGRGRRKYALFSAKRKSKEIYAITNACSEILLGNNE